MEKATQAREENIIANELEQIKLAITNAMAQGLDGKVSDVNLKNALQGIIDDEELENITGDGPWTITTKLKKTYEINGYGQIEETAVLEPTDIYVALDGTTLRFYNSIENVPQNLVSSLYTDSNGPRNFKDVDFEPQESSPWYNNRTNITRVSIENVIVPTITKRWFNECAITGVDHIENLNTSCVTNMGRMFRNCSNLIELDVSKFDTRNVTDMQTMFQSCSKLTALDVSNFKTGKVENMQWMFNGCSGLTELDVSKWDTSNVTNMSTMFQNCTGLTELDLSNWDTKKVTDMQWMFNGCSGLTELDVSKWDTSNVTNMLTIFRDCTGLTELDLSGFDTSKVRDMFSMFSGCSNLITIYVGDKWNTNAVTRGSYMFENCKKLIGGEGTTYGSTTDWLDETKAKVDGGPSSPGYFTHINDKVTN